MKQAQINSAKFYAIISLMRAQWPHRSMGELIMAAFGNCGNAVMNASDEELVDKLTEYHQGINEDAHYMQWHKKHKHN